MVARFNRADHYIFVMVSIFLLLFFLTKSQRSETGYLPYFHTWCGLSGNLGCRSEMCCTRLAENTGCKNLASLGHPCKFQRVSRLGSVTARHSSRPTGRQPKLCGVELCHLYSTGRPSRWAFAHIAVAKVRKVPG